MCATASLTAERGDAVDVGRSKPRCHRFLVYEGDDLWSEMFDFRDLMDVLILQWN